MKTFKKLFFAAIFAVVAIALVGCKGGGKKLDEAYDRLEIQFAEGDTADAVTQNVTLPTTDGDVIISWKSSNLEVIDNNGVVYRGAEDKDVTLTATLTLGEDSKDKEFNLKVLKEEKIEGLDLKLKEHYKDTIGNDDYQLTEDIELIDNVDGHPVVWETSKPDILGIDGKVSRPEFAIGNETVRLTATVGGNKVTFFVTVKALEQTVEEAITAALAFVTTFPSTEGEYQDKNVTTAAETDITYQGTTEKVAVTWTTSDETVMTKNGELVPFEDAPEKEVTLTASITYKDVTLSKDVKFKVRGLTEYETFLEALLPENLGAKIAIPQVKYYGMSTENADGYYLIDPEGNLAFVYSTDAPAADKVYKLTAVVDQYYGAAQLKSCTFTEVPEAEQKEFKEVKVETITIAEKVAHDLPDEEDNWAQSTPYKYESVRVWIDSTISDDRYKVFIIPETADTENPGSERIMLYYKSDISHVEALAGQVLESITLIDKGYRTDLKYWYGSYLGDGSDLIVDATPAEKVEANLSNAKRILESSPIYAATEKANFADGTAGVTLTFESQNTDILTNEGAVVEGAFPETVTDVKVKITATLGDVTDDIEATVKVGKPNLITIAEARDAAKGTEVAFDGVFVAHQGNRNLSVQDDTAGITVRLTKGQDGSIGSELQPGDKVRVVGEISVFNELLQVGEGLVIIKLEGTETVNLVELSEISEATLLANESNGIKITQKLEVTSAPSKDTYGNLSLYVKLGADSVQIRMDSRRPEGDLAIENIDDLELKVGDFIMVNKAVVGNYNGTPQLTYAEISVAELTEAEQAAIIMAEVKDLVDGKEFYMGTEAPVLPETKDEATLTYTYEPALDTLVDADGNFLDVTEDKTVTVTINLVLGETPLEEIATFTVKYLDPDAAATYTETFEGASIGADYTDFTHTGVNDTEFRMTHVRDEGDYGIDGNGVMLRGGEAGKDSAFEFTVTNGLSALSFDYKKAFTGQTLRKWNVELVQDGVVVKTHEIPEFNDDDTTHKVELTDLNLTGEVTIRIVPRTTSKSMQMTIDNITWTEAE